MIASAAYYNDNDPFCAQWLRNLIAAGAIPGGYLDERSIANIDPSDLAGYRHVHFFAGIGGWAYALQLAGWPPDRPLWTGSCPCQPFSSAGRQGGALDERHLWPRWLRLIRECRPHAILGEQVEGAVGFGWVDRVFADLEEEKYTCGAAVLGAHSVGAPHIRQRLFWVAQSNSAARWADAGAIRSRTAAGILDAARQDERRPIERAGHAVGCGAAGGVADADAAGSDRQRRQGLSGNGHASFGHHADRCGEAVKLAYSSSARSARLRSVGQRAERALGNGWDHRGDAEQGAGSGGGCDTGGLGDTARREMGRARQPWQDSVWLPCLDGKARRVEPQIQPLAAGIPNRVGLLRGSGNAITPQAAALFIEAVMEAI